MDKIKVGLIDFGLFTTIELSLIKASIEDESEIKRFQLVKDASHSIFVDQQADFIQLVKEFAK